MTELKKCPFCGGEVCIELGHNENDENPMLLWRIRSTNEYGGCVCRDIFIESYQFEEYEESQKEDAKERLIEMWNTRKPVEDVLERLEEVGGLKIRVIGGRCNGKTLQLGYQKGIKNAFEIVKEGLMDDKKGLEQ